MKEFVLAALPWVLCGIAVAIICAGLGNRKTKKKDAASEQRIALGMSLGLLLGVDLNSAGLWENHGLGLALGALWGMALAVLFPAKDGSNAD